MKYYVLTSRVETTMETPAIFSTYEKAHEQMEKEYKDRLEGLREDEVETISNYLGSDEAFIESDEYFEWEINACFVDELVE
jgi:hypothetical protein